MTPPNPKQMWDERFSGDEFVYGERPSRLLLGWTDFISANARTALVPACGEGRDAVYLASLGLDVTAVDISNVGLEKTQTLAQRYGVDVEIIEANLLEWDWPVGVYDVVVSTFAHTPSEIRGRLHRSFETSLALNGVICIEGFTKEQSAFQEKYGSGGPPDPDMLFSPDDIKSDFSELTSLSFFTGIETLFEGPGHNGPAALMRAVFQKTG